MAKLEDEVGKPLLHRSTRGVTPTESGVALYHHARFMLRQLNQALSIARQEAGGIAGMVSLGLPATTISAGGLPLVRRVRTKFPGILLNVVEGMSGHLSDMMRLGQLDLAILFTSDVASDLAPEALLDEELFVLLPSSSTLVPRGRTRITISEAAALPLILPTGAHGLRRRLTAEFRTAQSDATCRCGDRLVIAPDELRLRRYGATIKPLSALQIEGEPRSKWRTLAVSDAQLRCRNYLYSVLPDKLSPAATAVAKEVRDTAEQLVTSGQWKGVSLVDGLRPDGAEEVSRELAGGQCQEDPYPEPRHTTGHAALRF